MSRYWEEWTHVSLPRQVNQEGTAAKDTANWACVLGWHGGERLRG